MKGKYVSYRGPFIKGRWQDDNELNKPGKENQTGWGLKFDIGLGHIIRPVPIFWFMLSKKKIGDIPFDKWDKVFGKKLAHRLRTLKALKNDGERPMKYTVYNPWYAKYLFVLRLYLPFFFIGINTPWKSVYFGSKAYRIDPFENDMSWTNARDEKRATANNGAFYYALAPSASVRSHR